MNVSEKLHEEDVDLPVAAYAVKDEEDDEGWEFETLNRFQEYDENLSGEDFKTPSFVLGRDAEDAIVEARQNERQKILDKLEFEEYFEFQNKSEEFNQGFRKALEELRDELEEV